MKWMIFTPAVRTSAIGRMACLVTRTLLAQGEQVTVVRTESEEMLQAPTHDFGTEINSWQDADRVRDAANEAEVIVYQVGDNYAFHQGCLEWLPKLPGIVCLHDFFLGHLFYEWAEPRRAEAMEILHVWYGETVAAQFFSHAASNFIEKTKDNAPMTEWICAMAEGVMTHSRWGIARVLASCPGPVSVVALPISIPSYPSSDTSSKKTQFQILTVGHVNPNKRAASVIAAIGNDSILREQAVYHLVGAISDETKSELSALAEEYQVNLRIFGEVDDMTLQQAVLQADVVSCLRWPVLEGASASAIEALLYGKPTIVTDAGFYQEIPDTCVIKIDPDNEISDLRSAILLLFQDKKKREALGLAGQAWAQSTFTVDNYIQSLRDLVLSVNQAKPWAAAAEHFLNQLMQWGATKELIQLQNTVTLPFMPTITSNK